VSAKSGGFNAREVDASEYEPQIVELPSSPEPERSSHDEGEEAMDTSRGGSEESEDSSTDSRSSRSSSEESETPAAVEGKPTSNGNGGDGMEVDGGGSSAELTEKQREELWVDKLGKMRERYLATMTEEERVEFFKRLEV
jgi:hypothetical protein